MSGQVCGGAVAALVVAGMSLLSSPAAQAQRTWAPGSPDDDPTKVMERPGFDLGVRIGFATPMGDLAQSTPLGDFTSSNIPLGLDIAIRGNKNVALGAGFELAPGLTKTCASGYSCSGTDYRLRLEVILTSRAGFSLDPWLGLGVGYEWLALSVSGSSAITLAGLDGIIEAGGEIRLGSGFAIGPFVGFSLGEYSSGSANGYSGSIGNPSLHEWLQLGLRGTANL
jgi:hypothetical protein